MRAKEFRTLLSDIFKEYNAFFGDNVGEFGEHDYKINYQINSHTLTERERVYIVDIDVWSLSTIYVENIADAIESLLNYATFETATFYLDTRYNADEKEIYRRTLSYDVRTFNE